MKKCVTKCNCCGTENTMYRRTGEDLKRDRLRNGEDRLKVGDTVNYIHGGTFTINQIDWRRGYVELHSHRRQFWTDINNVTLSILTEQYERIKNRH